LTEPHPTLRMQLEERSSYRGSLGARNWELIQPFKRPLSTCIQTPSRVVTFKRVPLGAVPRTRPFVEGSDLMFTPGRCKKTNSCFCDSESLWRCEGLSIGAADAILGEISAAMEGGESGRATPAGSGVGSGIPEEVCAGASSEDCMAAEAFTDCVAFFSPADSQK